MKTGIVIFAHGSSIETANSAVREVAAAFARDGGYELVEPAFLELGAPDLAQAVDVLIGRGAQKILVVPYFLTLGVHLQRDLPRIVEGISRVHNGIEIQVAPPLDGHPGLRQILVDRVREALQQQQ